MAEAFFKEPDPSKSNPAVSDLIAVPDPRSVV